MSFTNLLIVAAVAFAAPALIGLAPRLRLPAVVFEIVAGIAIGPSGLGWVQMDLPLRIVSQIGIAFLFFLAGLEIDLSRLRGRALRAAGFGFVLSVGVAAVAAFGLKAVGQLHPVESPVLVAIILLATSLGLVVPVLKDVGHGASDFGQLVIAGSSISEFGAVILLSLLFSTSGRNEELNILLLVALLLAAVVVALSLSRAMRSTTSRGLLDRLGDTSAQLRVRGAIVLLLALLTLAGDFGLETVLGAFLSGVILRVVASDDIATHPEFRSKLEGIGFGFLIPVFFITSGIEFNLQALLGSMSTLLRVPVFLAALLLVGGIPALLYRGMVGARRAVVAALLQATSLPFIVAATTIGVELKKISEATAAALVAAGLLSVVIFPLGALMFLAREDPAAVPE